MLFKRFVRRPDGKYYPSGYDSKKYTEQDLKNIGVVANYTKNKDYKFVEIKDYQSAPSSRQSKENNK